MIKDAYFRGIALAILAFEGTQMLYAQLRLAVEDADVLRALCFDCGMQCPDAAYRAWDDLWVIHFDALDSRVMEAAKTHLSTNDFDALNVWFRQGYAHKMDKDIALTLWIRSFHHANHHGWNKASVSARAIKNIDALIESYYFAWRDEDYENTVDAIRDAPDTLASIEFKTKFNINMYDDVLDPFVTLDGIRQGNILTNLVAELEEDFPFDAISQLSFGYLQEMQTYFKHIPADALQAAAKDIRCILYVD